MNITEVEEGTESKMDSQDGKFGASWLLIAISLLLTVPTIAISGLTLLSQYSDFGMILFGSIAPVIWSILIVGLFLIWKRFRNSRSRFRIYNWIMGVFLFSAITQLFLAIARVHS